MLITDEPHVLVNTVRLRKELDYRTQAPPELHIIRALDHLTKLIDQHWQLQDQPGEFRHQVDVGSFQEVLAQDAGPLLDQRIWILRLAPGVRVRLRP